MATVPQTPSLDNLLARYATPEGLPGYAIRTADHRVFFIDADAQCTQLDNSYRPHLVLLGVNLSERQQVLDRVAGGYAAVACSRDEGGRKMSPPPSPRIAPRFAPWWRTSRPRPRRSCPLRSTAASRPPSSWCWRTISRRTRMARPRWAAVTRSRWYRLVGTTCDCQDFTRGQAPEGWCQHRIAAGIHKRVQELAGEAIRTAPPTL